MTGVHKRARRLRGRRAFALVSAVAVTAAMSWMTTQAPVNATTPTPPAPPFTQCPAIGASPSCQILIVVNPDRTVSIYEDPSFHTYDGHDDTLVGVQNNSSAPVSAIALSSPGIAGFDGDGICDPPYNSQFTAGSGCPFGPTHYEGPNTSFTTTPGDLDNVQVNFSQTVAGLGANASAYFGLEQDVNGANLIGSIPVLASPTLATTPSGSTPAGGTASDSATLTGANNPTGTMTFNLYGPDDPACSNAIATITQPVSGATTDSGPASVGAPGTYNWVASYSGDMNNNPVAGNCGDESFTVTPQKMTGHAYAAKASVKLAGLALLNLAPVAETGPIATTSTYNSSTPCVATVTGIVGVKALCSSVSTVRYPGKSTAKASIASAVTGIPGLPVISVGAVQASSTTTCDGSHGAVTIAYLAVGGTVVIAKPTAIAPNTKINVGVVSLVLNEQKPVAGPDDGLTVNAIHVNVNALGLATTDIVLSSAESDISGC